LQRIVKDLKQKDPKEKNIYLDKIINNLNQYRKMLINLSSKRF